MQSGYTRSAKSVFTNIRKDYNYDLLYRDFRLGRDRPSWNLRIHCF